MTDQGSVSHITDDMVDAVERAWPRIWLDSDTHWRGKLRALLEAGLQGAAVGCAAATAGAPVSPVQSTDHADSRVSPVTDDMVCKGAAAMWGSPERDAMKISRMVLSAALAGSTVVALPEPNTTDSEGDPARTVTGTVDGPDDVVAYVVNGEPRVSAIGAPDEPDVVEAYAVTLLAAAREARRLAAGSQVGDQHDD